MVSRFEFFAACACGLAWGFALGGCPAPLPPEPAYVVFPPYDSGDSGVDALARVACENLAKLGCPESAGNGQGMTCSEVVTLAERTGNRLNLICVANASTIEQVRACQTIRCPGL